MKGDTLNKCSPNMKPQWESWASLQPITRTFQKLKTYIKKPCTKLNKLTSKVKSMNQNDALPSPGVNPLEGSPKCSCGKRDSEGRSRLPTLERGRGLSWEPKD